MDILLITFLKGPRYNQQMGDTLGSGGGNPCIFCALEKMQLTKSSFGQVVSTSNQTADKNKAVWREIIGTISRKQEQRLGQRVGKREEMKVKPLRIY